MEINLSLREIDRKIGKGYLRLFANPWNKTHVSTYYFQQIRLPVVWKGWTHEKFHSPLFNVHSCLQVMEYFCWYMLV